MYGKALAHAFVSSGSTPATPSYSFKRIQIRYRGFLFINRPIPAV